MLFFDLLCGRCEHCPDDQGETGWPGECAIMLDMAVEGRNPAVVYDEERGVFSDGVGKVWCKQFVRKTKGLHVVTDEDEAEWNRLNRRARE
jgi:hypothetical protein